MPSRVTHLRRPCLEPLESRALCAVDPFHSIVPASGTFGATLKPDGTIELVGLRRTPHPTVIGPISVPATGPHFDFGIIPEPLGKWTIAPDGRILGVSDFEPPVAGSGKQAAILSPDGTWAGSALPPTLLGTPGLPVIWRPGTAGYTPVGLPANQEGFATLLAVSNSGVAFYRFDVGQTSDYYEWSEGSEPTRLRSLYEAEENASADARRVTVTAISADGQTIVGTSGGGNLPFRATVWRGGTPEALPAGGLANSGAMSVSASGRVIGGYIRDGDKSFAAVWLDGVLQDIDSPSGSVLSSNRIVQDVVEGLGDDPHGWAAVGWDWGKIWIARSDGIVHELYSNDPNTALSLAGDNQVRELLADSESLYLVTQEFSYPLIGGCFGCVYDMTPRIQAHVLRMPLNYVFDAASHYDLSGDQNNTAIDALIVINALNANPGKPLHEQPALRVSTPKIDVNGDGELTASDALAIINYLNNRSETNQTSNAAEGETGSRDSANHAAATDEYFFELSQPKKRSIW